MFLPGKIRLSDISWLGLDHSQSLHFWLSRNTIFFSMLSRHSPLLVHVLTGHPLTTWLALSLRLELSSLFRDRISNHEERHRSLPRPCAAAWRGLIGWRWQVAVLRGNTSWSAGCPTRKGYEGTRELWVRWILVAQFRWYKGVFWPQPACVRNRVRSRCRLQCRHIVTTESNSTAAMTNK